MIKRFFLTLIGAAALTHSLPAMASEKAESVWITLGTNSGPIPLAQRSQPANLLLKDGHRILIDVGDGAVEQLGKTGLEFTSIDTLFISHHHLDHIGGLFSLIGRRYQVRAPNVLTIYGPPGTKAIVDNMIGGVASAFLAAGVVKERAPLPPADTVRVIEIRDADSVTLGDMTVTAVANSHYAVLAADAPEPKPQSLSFRFDLPTRSIVYTGDTGPSGAVERLAAGADLLISEIIDPQASVDELRVTRPDFPEAILASVLAHHTHEHLTAAEVGKLAGRAKVGALVLTHNPIKDDKLDKARAEIAAHYDGPITFASDLDHF